MDFLGNPNGFGGPLGVQGGDGNPMHGGPPLNPRPQPAGAGFDLVLPGPSGTSVGSMDVGNEGGQRRFSHAGNTVMMNPSSKLASGKFQYSILHCCTFYLSKYSNRTALVSAIS